MQKPHVLLYLLAALTSHAFAGILPDSVKIATDEKKAQAEVSFRFEPNDPITTIQSARILGFEEGASTGTEVGDAQFTPFSNLEDHSIACAYVVDFAAQLRSTMKNKNFSKNTVRALANTGSVTQTTIYSVGRDLEVISPLGDPTSTALDRLEGYNGYLKRPDGFKSSFIVQHLSEVVTKLKDATTKRKVIVLFTDGQDTTRNDTAWQWDTKFANVLALCKSNDIAVHVVGMAQDPKVWDKGYAWLRDLANGTGRRLV